LTIRELLECEADGVRLFRQVRHPDREPWLEWEDGIFWLFRPGPDKDRPSAVRLSALDAWKWLIIEGYPLSAEGEEFLKAILAQFQVCR
jgi:hypothetical protein